MRMTDFSKIELTAAAPPPDKRLLLAFNDS
jgi:hypothetical protein